jgi:Ca-activated chloride channel family protein
VAEISLLHPEVLWAVPALAALYAAWLLFRRRRFLAFSAVSRLQLLAHHRPSPFRRLPAVLAAAALVLIFVALMEPVIPYSESTIEAEGLDIVLVVDLSSSMAQIMGVNTEGVATTRSRLAGKAFATRLEVSKQSLRDFIEKRRHDRIGLVVFSDNAYVISPLTFDYGYLLRYVDDIDDTLMQTEGMTAIGEGIYLADVLFTKQSQAKGKNKVMVVLTDGAHNIGRDPIPAIDETSAEGIRTYVIGVDMEESIKKTPAVSRLIETVKAHGGRYFQANSARQMEAANATLATLEKGRLAGKTFVRNVPVFQWFAMPAIGLLAIALALRVIPFFLDMT